MMDKENKERDTRDKSGSLMSESAFCNVSHFTDTATKEWNSSYSCCLVNAS